MSFDFSEVLLNPIYNSSLGVDAVLSLGGGSSSETFSLRVIDETAGVNVGLNVDVPTILPRAAIRYAELSSNGLNKNDIIGGTLTFNGFSWTISNVAVGPTPSGERRGEVFAMLENQTELAPSSE